ncbi:MAG: carboxypeptidase-like regulatory domain-containing protein, partial [Syntrophomonadaceae bacterium]
MKKAFIIFCLLSSCLLAQTGYTLSGRVFDETADKPLVNVNVYLSNSLLGSMTNDSGYYKITGIHEGQYEVVASLVGYETISHVMFFDNVRQQKKDFKLSQKTYILEGISVTADNAKEWKENYNLFRRLFLGKSPFADECEIENKELVDFKRESFDLLNASAKVPLIIVNKALGYRLNCILQ